MKIMEKLDSLKKTMISFYRKILDKIKGFRIKVKLSKKVIILISSIAAVILLAAAAGYYYYFYIYTKPNFDDSLYNNMITSSMKEVEPGDILDYELNYKNTGYRQVGVLDISIPIPDHTEPVSFSEGGEYDEDGKVLTYSINDIARDGSGKIIFELLIDEPLDNGTEIDPGIVEFVYSIGEDVFEKKLQGSPAHIVKSSPDFSSFSISSADLNGGLLSLEDEIKYTIKIKNSGNMVAREVQIITDISPFLIIDPETISQSGTIDGDAVNWIFDELGPGDSKTLTFKAKLGGGEIQDKEEVITTAVLLYGGKETESGKTVDTARLFPDFSGTTAALADANGGGYLWAGETISVRVTLKNTGQRKADKYQLYCPIPAPVTYVSQSGTADGIRWDDGIRGLIWDLEGLEVGESRDITFSMTVNNDYYYKSGTVNTEFYVTAGEDEFLLEPASIYIQGHPYLNVVAMGDSLIARSDWVQRLDNKLEAAFPAADYNTSASAVNGEMSFQGLARYDSTVGPLNPTILIIDYGSNDVGASQSYFRYSIDTIIAKAKGQGATVFINLIGPISAAGKSEWPIYNNIIRQVAAKYGIPVIDVTSALSTNKGGYLADGLHYTPAGAEVVAQTVFNNIVPYLNGLGGRR